MGDFVSRWGYLAVFLGSLVEGESVILAAGYFSSQGYLSIKKVILIAFIGTVIADQSLFVCGKIWGKRFLKRFPSLDQKIQRVFYFLNHYKLPFLLLFRFIYGIRVLSPIVVGASPISFRYFSVINLIAGAFWAFSSCMVSYLFGGYLMSLPPLQRFVVLGSIGFVFLALLLWKAYTFFWKDSHK